jgi:hypothetical protein
MIRTAQEYEEKHRFPLGVDWFGGHNDPMR